MIGLYYWYIILDMDQTNEANFISTFWEACLCYLRFQAAECYMIQTSSTRLFDSTRKTWVIQNIEGKEKRTRKRERESDTCSSMSSLPSFSYFSSYYHWRSISKLSVVTCSHGALKMLIICKCSQLKAQKHESSQRIANRRWLARLHHIEQQSNENRCDKLRGIIQ